LSLVLLGVEGNYDRFFYQKEDTNLKKKTNFGIIKFVEASIEGESELD